MIYPLTVQMINVMVHSCAQLFVFFLVSSSMTKKKQRKDVVWITRHMRDRSFSISSTTTAADGKLFARGLYYLSLSIIKQSRCFMSNRIGVIKRCEVVRELSVCCDCCLCYKLCLSASSCSFCIYVVTLSD